MDRKNVVSLWQAQGLDRAAKLYGVSRNDLHLHDDYLGCQNLVYKYLQEGRSMILRISYREDRPLELIQAEIHFINYLADHGVRVSRAQPSRNGSLVELLQIEERSFGIVSFEKARGMRVPDNHYRYREGVSIDEYCQNWGRILGQMHRQAQQYVPPESGTKRPGWLERWSEMHAYRIIPESMMDVRQKFQMLLTELRSLPQNGQTFGLIHGDFNDGNFCVDYENGNITVFDFDDACYGWYAYELASAWEGFVGRAMFEPDVEKRRELMDHYYAKILLGYNREYILPAFWLEKLPFFLKVIEMDSLLERLAYWQDNQLPVPDDDQEEVDYLVRCITDDIPYLGLFDPVFCHERPFRLV